MKLNKTNQKIVDCVNRGYTIDKQGVVRNPKNNIIVGSACKDGYISSILGTSSTNTAFHRLQGYFKFGDEIFGEGIQVRHLNGDPSDNSWENIDIGTSLDNNRDKHSEVVLRAAKIATRHVIREDWVEIDKDRKSGLSYGELRDKYQVSKSTLSYRYGNGKIQSKKIDLE